MRTYVSISYRPKHTLPLVSRRVTSILKSRFALVGPPKYTNSVVCLYPWPAAVALNDTVSTFFVCSHTISVMASETVSPKDARAVTITAITLSKPPGDRDAMPASSAYSIPHNGWSSSSPPPPPPPPPSALPGPAFPLSSTTFPYFVGVAPCCPIMATATKRFSATRSTAVEKMLTQQWPEYTPLPKTLLDINHIRALAIV